LLTALFPIRETILKELDVLFSNQIEVSRNGVILDTGIEKFANLGYLVLEPLPKKSVLDKNRCLVHLTPMGKEYVSTLVGKLVQVASRDDAFWKRCLSKFLLYMKEEHLVIFFVSQDEEIRNLAIKRIQELHKEE